MAEKFSKAPKLSMKYLKSAPVADLIKLESMSSFLYQKDNISNALVSRQNLDPADFAIIHNLSRGCTTEINSTGMSKRILLYDPTGWDPSELVDEDIVVRYCKTHQIGSLSDLRRNLR